MLASEEYPMKVHKNQWVLTMPYPLERLAGATRRGQTMAPEGQKPLHVFTTYCEQSTFMGYHRLCTKNPVSMLTHRSIRPFWPHFEGFFEIRETYFYS